MTIGSIVRAYTAPFLVALPLLFGTLVVPSDADADVLSDATAEIELLIAEGRQEDAMSAARQFVRLVSDMTGFGVTNAQLIEGAATGFGVFEPRDSNVYMPGEAVNAYVEVFGFSLTSSDAGTNRLLFDVAFTLDSPGGEQMTDALIPMGEIQLESYSEPLDGYFHLTYRVSGADGAYNLRTQVTDRESGQVTEFVLPVVFETPDPPAEQSDKQ